MADVEQKRETGGSLMFVGLTVWIAGLLVLFYFPAGSRLGQQPGFIAILIVLAVLGAVLMGRGWSIRRKENSE
jgi:uncharacterized membrane protein YqjE